MHPYKVSWISGLAVLASLSATPAVAVPITAQVVNWSIARPAASGNDVISISISAGATGQKV